MYHFYQDHGGGSSAEIDGSIYFRGGAKKVPTVRLTKSMEKKLVAYIDVATDGTVSIKIQ